ncbi:unnamed protein product [Orchesella dallaii]|uniref:Uncharacterized protein n=1 Tax=Orchesella dallaii TaxID=48710 RepID=A0ABP1QTD6_9HEXA
MGSFRRFDETQTTDPIEYDKTLSRQVAFEGQPYMMKCAVRGNAAPRLLWSVDGQIPDKEKYRITWEGLQILNVSETDADKHFTCRAFSSHTSVSESEMMNITLRIRMEPRSRQIGNLGMKSYGVIGEWANLTCAVRAEPAVTFEWFHQGQPIQNASDIRITNEENQSTLRVLLDDDNEEKLGYYMCRAINELGHLVQTIILLKVEKPPPPILNVLSVSPDEVQISAKTSYSRMGKRFPPLGYTIQYIPHCRTATGNSENDWIPVNGHSRPLENHDGFVLTKLSHGTAYCIRAAVLNVATVGFFSPPLKVVTRLANAEKVKDQTAGNSRILPSAFSIVMMAMITGFPVTQIVTYR